MTTLEDRIADLQQQAGLLLDLPQQIADTATARINALGDYWQQAQAQMYARHYVHQLAGDDQADGTETAPLRSIEEAIRRTPVGGECKVILLGDYHIDARVQVGRRRLVLTSSSTVRHQITIEQTLEQIGTAQQRGSGGLVLAAGASVDVVGLTVVIPDASGAYSLYTPHPTLAGVAQMDGTASVGAGAISLRYCDITIPATPHCALVGSYPQPLELYAASLVVTGQLEGNLISAVQTPTDPATLPWLLTNLTTV